MIEPSPIGERGLLGADREVFGAAISHSRISQIEAKFFKTLANNRVTSTNTGTGTTSQANGQASVSTGTGTTASARIESIKRTNYFAGREIYAMFTGKFTTPTHASSYQRIGIFDDNNGFWIGYDGLTFGSAVRSGGVDTFTSLADSNGDPMDSSFRSRFARGGVNEDFDPTNLNVKRIRFGWLGSSLEFVDIQSPDGNWMRINANRFPNLQDVPSILNPNLPIRMEVGKTNADATDLILKSGSWDAGFVGNPYGLEPSEVFGREHVNANISVTGGLTATNTQVYLNNSGRRFHVTDLFITAVNTVTTGGEGTITDGNGGPIKFRFQIAPSTNQAKPTTEINHTFKEPFYVQIGAYITLPILGIGGAASVNLYGYEDSDD